jgi:hypothetical protein
MTEYQQRKQCPFAFNQPVGHNMRCLEDQCMAWGEIKYGCTRPNKEETCEREGSCYSDCDLWKPTMGCKLIERQP